MRRYKNQVLNICTLFEMSKVFHEKCNKKLRILIIRAHATGMKIVLFYAFS